MKNHGKSQVESGFFWFSLIFDFSVYLSDLSLVISPPTPTGPTAAAAAAVAQGGAGGPGPHGGGGGPRGAGATGPSAGGPGPHVGVRPHPVGPTSKSCPCQRMFVKPCRIQNHPLSFRLLFLRDIPCFMNMCLFLVFGRTLIPYCYSILICVSTIYYFCYCTGDLDQGKSLWGSF